MVAKKVGNSTKAPMIITDESFIMDIDIIEAPLFVFNKSKLLTVREMISSDDVMDDIKDILTGVPADRLDDKFRLLQWVDSKNLARALLMTSPFEFPNFYGMDVLYAMIKLYLEKNAPLTEKDGILPFADNEVKFTLSDICRVLGVTICGGICKKIKQAIRHLNAVTYYSFENGAFYDKQYDCYVTSRERSINLIDTYRIDEKSKYGRIYEVKLGELIISNLKHKHMKILNCGAYYELPHGMARRLYSYVEGNRYNKRFIKRSFDVLKHKIPIDFKYPSELKTKINTGLDSLIKFGHIKDYFYGDEIAIEGVKEKALYIIFKGNRQETIETVIAARDAKRNKNRPAMVEDIVSQTAPELVLPTDVIADLRGFGVSERAIDEAIDKCSHWMICAYILWIKDGLAKGKINSPASMFVFAALQGMVKLDETHRHILDFIKVEKYKVEYKSEKLNDEMDVLYEEYVDKCISDYKNDNEFIYVPMKSKLMDDIEKAKSTKIKNAKAMYKYAKTDDERKAQLIIIENWERASVHGENSPIFRDMMAKNIKLITKVKDREQFKAEYINGLALKK